MLGSSLSTPPRPGQAMALARPTCSPGKRAAGRHAPARHRTSTVTSVLALPADTLPPRLTDADVASYNAEMASRMGWASSSSSTPAADPFKYDPSTGIAYHHAVYDARTLCGPQPLTPAHVHSLASDHGVSHILCLQEDHDPDRWGVDGRAIREAAREAGVIHIRVPARDFDPHSLRRALPAAAGALELARRAAGPAGGRVYIHCTAGLGRAPATCIAHAMWFRGMDLERAYAALTAVRPCGPNREAIRGSTYDLAYLPGTTPRFSQLPPHAFTDLSEAERGIVGERALKSAEGLVAEW